MDDNDLRKCKCENIRCNRHSGNTQDLGIPRSLHMKYLFASKILRSQYFQ